MYLKLIFIGIKELKDKLNLMKYLIMYYLWEYWEGKTFEK